MRRIFSTRRVLVLLFMIAVATMGRSPSQLAGGGQQQERTIKKAPARDEPIKIEKIKVKGKPVLNDKFFEDDDWLKGLTINVKNTSGRIIKYVELDLVFPRPNDSPNQPVSRDHLIYGQYPLQPGEAGPANPQPPVMPGDTVEIALTDYEGTMDFLLHTNYRSIKQLEIEIGMVIFDDDTKWSGGRLYRRDPTRPDGWMLLPAPGKKTPNTSSLGPISTR